MSAKKPLYIREPDGSVTPIKDVLGIYPRQRDSHEQTGLNFIANLNPELVISREDYMKLLHKNIIKNYETMYRPMVDALKKYRKMTPRQVSGVTEMPENEAKEFLERFHKAGFLGKKGEAYTMSPENEKDITNSFGLE